MESGEMETGTENGGDFFFCVLGKINSPWPPWRPGLRKSGILNY